MPPQSSAPRHARLISGIEFLVSALLLAGVGLGAERGQYSAAVAGSPGLAATHTGTTSGTDQSTVIKATATSPVSAVGQTSSVVSTT